MSNEPTEYSFGRDRWQQSSEQPPAAVRRRYGLDG